MTQEVAVEKEWLTWLFGGSGISKLKEWELEYSIRIKLNDDKFIVSGDRDRVVPCCQFLERQLSEIKNKIKSISVKIKKGQHRLLIGPKGATLKKLYDTTQCVLVIPPPESSEESVEIRGPQEKLAEALQWILECANQVWLEEMTVQGLFEWCWLLSERTGSLKQHLADVQYTLRALDDGRQGGIVELQGKKERVTQVRQELEEVLQVLARHVHVSLDVSHSLHRYLFHKPPVNADKTWTWVLPKLKLVDSIRASWVAASGKIEHGGTAQQDSLIRVLVPPSTTPYLPEKDLDHVFLHVGPSPDRASPTVVRNGLSLLSKDLMVILKKMDDLVTLEVKIDAKFHGKLIGAQGRDIKALKAQVASQLHSSDNPEASSALDGDLASSYLTITFPSADDENQDVVKVRGTKREVELCAQLLKKATEDIRHHDVMHSFTETVVVARNAVAGIIGRGGAGLQQITELTDTKIQIDNDSKDESDKAMFTIQGTKKGVETAKQLLKQRSQTIEDFTTLDVSVESKYHPRLIGRQGSEVKKLQTKYNIRIQFSKQNQADSGADIDEVGSVSSSGQHYQPLPADTIRIRGPREHVNAAAQEIQEYIKWETENGYRLAFLVGRDVTGSIIGRNGSNLAAIKERALEQVKKRSKVIPGAENQVYVHIFQEEDAKRRMMVESSMWPLDSYEGQKLEPSMEKSLVLITGSKELVHAIRDLILTHVEASMRFVTETVEVDGVLAYWLVSGVSGLDGAFKPRYVGIIHNLHAKDKESFSVDVPSKSLLKKKSESGASITVTLKGDKDAVDEFAEILKSHAPGQSKAVVRKLVDVKAGDIRFIIGPGGSFANKLRADHDIEIDFPPSNSKSNIDDDVQAAIYGTEKQVQACIAAIRAEVESKQRPSQHQRQQKEDRNGSMEWVTLELQHPPSTYRYIIGTRGTTIQQIRDVSRCRIDMPPKNADPDAPIVLRGKNEEDLQLAKQMIQDVVSNIRENRTIAKQPPKTETESVDSTVKRMLTARIDDE